MEFLEAEHRLDIIAVISAIYFHDLQVDDIVGWLNDRKRAALFSNSQSVDNHHHYSLFNKKKKNNINAAMSEIYDIEAKLE